MATMSMLCVLIGLLALQLHPVPTYSFNIPHDLNSIVQYLTNTRRSDGCESKVDPSIEVISWEPRAVIYHNFLSKEECEHVIDIAKPHMKKSTIRHFQKGEIEDTIFRTCSITSLERGQDETIRAIERRIADFSFLPVENGEGLQIQHYEVGQKFETHHDYTEFGTRNGGQTIATIEMYLSDVEEGGETVFPFAVGNTSTLPCWNERYTHFNSGLSVRPKMGDALLFWSTKPDATPDDSSTHGVCPIIKGSKWSATKWIHVNKYKV